MAAGAHRAWVVAGLGTAQTLGWASSYYLPALLAAPMAREFGVGTPTVFAGFSMALAVSALVGPAAGQLIDRHGGRPVLMATSGLFALALLALGLAPSLPALLAAFALLGVAMGSGLYEAAFAALVRLYGQGARNSITGITLIAGLASTVGWPLTAWMAAQHGWRGACLGWAVLHLLLGLPLYARLPSAPAAAGGEATDDPSEGAPDGAAPLAGPPDAGGVTHPATAAADAPPARLPPSLTTTALLAYVFAATWFISTAMAAHLPSLLQQAGSTLAVAVGVAALVGPAQVAGRLLEFGLLRRVHPLLSARLAALTHPVGAAALLLMGPVAAPVFALLHGAGNGILTIAKGTLPLVLFGAQGYGARQGWLMMPARLAQAAAPLAFGLALQRWGAQALWLTWLLGLSSLAALLALRGVVTAAAERHDR